MDLRLAIRALAGLVRLALLLVFVALAAFFLVRLSPVDPVDAYLGPAMARVGPEQRAAIAAAWGLDQPFMIQFFHWLRNIVSGNLGFSTAYHADVADIIRDRAGPTLALAGSAWLLSGLLGFALGVCAGVFEGGRLDKAIRAWCIVLASTPTFWLAFLLLALFSVKLGWTPVCCTGPIGVPASQVSFSERLLHLVLPLTALTLFGVAQIALHTRERAVDIMRSDFVLFARAQGASRGDIALHHVARNACLPAMSLFFASIGEIFGGAMLAEQVFAYPGLGRATVEAGLQGDIALLLAMTLLTALVVALGRWVADLVARAVDPRLRASDEPFA